MVQVEHQNVLVTGGTGLVGSHLVELLLQRGYTVTCLVRDPAHLRWISGLDVRLIKGDCSLPGSLVSAVKDASLVFHAAGLTKARRAREYYEVNHLGTRNILEACARYNPGISKFILVSSLAAVGASDDGTPVKDTDRPRPVSDYGKSKLLAEEEAMQYKDHFPVVILRPSAVYGPRDADMFELFRWAARGLWLELAGGDRFVNPCFVKDLASALLLAAEKRTASGSIYFVGEDRPYSWSEFRDALLSSGGVKARTLKIPCWAAYLMGLASEFGSIFTSRPALTNRQKVREAVQRYWKCDLTKIENELGFRAAFPLEKGLRITWEWYRKQGWIT
jgi:nucleoside-diphosphate-sugar epimerase